MSKAWMPIYWGDYFRDTSRLTTLQHGAYLLLIAHYWCNGGIPNDDRQLHRITRCPNNSWKETWAAISPFFSVERNRSGSLELKHKRIDAELSKAADIGLKRQIYGAKGGLANRGQTNQERNYGKAFAKQRDDQSQSYKNLLTLYPKAKRTSEEEA